MRDANLLLFRAFEGRGTYERYYTRRLINSMYLPLIQKVLEAERRFRRTNSPCTFTPDRKLASASTVRTPRCILTSELSATMLLLPRAAGPAGVSEQYPGFPGPAETECPGPRKRPWRVPRGAFRPSAL